MKPSELRQQCEHQLRLFKNMGESNITLVQRGRWGKSNTRKLFGVSGDQGTLARYIGSSPANYKKCTGCGKCLKVERKASYSRQTGICSECRRKARRLKGNGSEEFRCLNCLGKFERKHWEVRTRIKRSKRASPPIFCGNKCHNEYRRSHHIKGRQPCQF